MKKGKIILIFLLLLSLSVVAIACNNTKEQEEPEKTEETTITLSAKSMILEQYAEGKLTATVENGEGKSVTWSSDSPQIASVDGDGNVNALEIGSAVITAKVDNAVATCNVTVTEASDYPIIQVSQTEVEPAVGNTVSVTADLYYKGEPQSAVLTWTSDNEAVATVEDGTITGVSVGSTNITVSADFHGEKISRNISVKVKENASIGLDKSIIELYASDPSEKGDYKTSEPISATVIENDKPVTDPQITWTSSDENVATYADGSITAKGRGTAVITATWVTSLGTELSATVNVTVNVPVVNASITTPSDVVLTDSVKKIDLDLYSLTVEEGAKVYDDTVEIGAVNAGNEIVFTDALTYGEKLVQIRTSKVYYEINIVAITKVIATAGELQDLASYGNPTTNSDGIKVYSGYFVLGADIYLESNATFKLHYDNNDKSGAAGVTGLNGIFDGRGHMIYGGTYGRGGLLGGVSNGSIVRNVSFIGAKVSGSGAAAVICEELGGTISDVLIDTYLENGSPVAYITSGEVNMTNVVVYVSQATGLDKAAIVEWIGSGSVLSINNVYLFSDMSKHFGLTQGSVTGSPTQYAYNAKLTDADVKVSLDGWDLSGDKAWLGEKPQIIADMIEEAITDCSVTAVAGKTFELSLSGITVTTDLAGNAQRQYITVEGLTITVSEDLEESTNFKYTVTWNWYPSITKTVTVTVTKELEIQELFVEGLYEQYTGYAEGKPTENTAGFTINLTEALSDASIALDGATFVLTTDSKQISLSDVGISGQSITIPRDSLKDLLGEYTLSITVPNEAIYTVPVTIATKLITQTEDLQNMPFYGGITSKDTPAEYSGYFVMTQNVNMGETKFSNNNWMNLEANTGFGFQGVFDGRGYSVIGGTYERGGVFLTVGQRGVIKNVAFVGGKILGGWSNYSLLAQNIYGELNNIFIGNVENKESSLGALLGSRMIAKLTNVVIYANGGNHSDCSSLSVGLDGGTTSLENVYIFSDIKNSDGTVKIAQVAPNNATGTLHAYTFEQIVSEEVTVSGLTTYWDTKTYDVPVFESSLEYLAGNNFFSWNN